MQDGAAAPSTRPTQPNLTAGFLQMPGWCRYWRSRPALRGTQCPHLKNVAEPACSCEWTGEPPAHYFHPARAACSMHCFLSCEQGLTLQRMAACCRPFRSRVLGSLVYSGPQSGRADIGSAQDAHGVAEGWVLGCHAKGSCYDVGKVLQIKKQTKRTSRLLHSPPNHGTSV